MMSINAFVSQHCLTFLLDTVCFTLCLFNLKAFADSVSSQKRAAADGECREESLLQETASKEAAMATRMEEVQAELKQSRLALSNTHAEIERLGVVSTQLKKVWCSVKCNWYCFRYSLIK